MLRLNRLFSTVKNIKLNRSAHSKGSYDGDGKTTVKVLNNDAEYGLLINGISTAGFRLNNGFSVIGPMVIFPRSVLSWGVSSVQDITEKSLSLLTVLEPKLDILVIGTGDTLQHNVYLDLLKFMREQKITVEVLPTEAASTTFNFLNSESRCVAAALIPPRTLRIRESDVVVSKVRQKILYERED